MVRYRRHTNVYEELHQVPSSSYGFHVAMIHIEVWIDQTSSVQQEAYVTTPRFGDFSCYGQNTNPFRLCSVAESIHLLFLASIESLATQDLRALSRYGRGKYIR